MTNESGKRWEKEESKVETTTELAGRTSFEEVRKWLWKCRENEIVHMWQRGAFLATFIVGAFTAYAKLLCHWHGDSIASAALAIAISTVGMLLSLLWIAMAKGSSAWYSIYERAISNLVKAYFKDVTDEQERLLVDVIGTKCPLVAGCSFEENEKWSDSYWNGAGGRFSLPKINVAIGQLLFVAWFVITGCHLLLLAGLVYPKLVCIREWRMFIVYVTFGCPVVALLVYYFCYSKMFLKSGSLTNYEEELNKQCHRHFKRVRAVFRSVKIIRFFTGSDSHNDRSTFRA